MISFQSKNAYLEFNGHTHALTNFCFSFVLQHSFVVCLEPPKSAEDHISMLSAAAIDDTDKALKIAAHHAFLKQSKVIKSISDEDYVVSLYSHFYYLPISLLLEYCQQPID